MWFWAVQVVLGVDNYGRSGIRRGNLKFLCSQSPMAYEKKNLSRLPKFLELNTFCPGNCDIFATMKRSNFIRSSLSVCFTIPINCYWLFQNISRNFIIKNHSTSSVVRFNVQINRCTCTTSWAKHLGNKYILRVLEQNISAADYFDLSNTNIQGQYCFII